MNVTKTEKDYAISINEDTTIELDYAAVTALIEFVDKESYKEDVKLAVDREYDEGTADKLPDDLLDEITELYVAKRGESEEWDYLGREAVNEYDKQIENILGEKEIVE